MKSEKTKPFLTFIRTKTSRYTQRVHSAGIEPATHNLEGCCSTPTELRMPKSSYHLLLKLYKKTVEKKKL